MIKYLLTTRSRALPENLIITDDPWEHGTFCITNILSLIKAETKLSKIFHFYQIVLLHAVSAPRFIKQ